jgi:inhibitor of cysteine peptidase
MLAIDEAQTGQTVDLAVGQVIELRLKENPTTGFQWQVRRDGAPNCRVVTDSREPGAATPLPGKGGTHIWRIEGARVGICEMELAYIRPWESDRPPGTTFTVRIRVTSS